MREPIVIRVGAAASPGRVDEVAAAHGTKEFDDPRVAFALLLSLEVRRRGGEQLPRVELEVGPREHAPLQEATREYLPWVEIVCRAEASGGVGPPPRAAGSEVSPSRLVSAEELAMLLDLPERRSPRSASSP
ncbi:MAG: hypothetical protein KF724_07135 [Phycisphaeraceae bacterium]|nr:hypothetical protein [Phycisphaeraceae bacterium]